MARGKTSSDASELEKLEWPYDWPPPWRSDRLVGHEAAEKTMLAAHQSGRLHHAWLLAGPRGIGKATLAWCFARFLLSGEGQGGLFGGGPESLDVAADAPGRALVDARSHPDLFHLRRTLNPDTGRMRAEIAVDEVRQLGAFMHMTPAMGKWRVAIVDAADEMNRNSANAVLKILEEPPPNAVLLMVAHTPGRLLPTIRSRCRRLALQPLADEVVMRLLGDYAPGVKAEERVVLARLSEGSIGGALELAGAGSLELYREMVDVLATLPDLDMVRLHGFAERFARRGEEANAAWRSLNYLFDGWLKGLARHAALGGKAAPIVPSEGGLHDRLLAAVSLDRWIEAWEKVAHLFSRADAVNLDRKQTVLGSFGSPIGDALDALIPALREGRQFRSSVIMSGRSTYYVTTPIYYVNDVPHIGHAYTTLACDVLARFMRLDGRDVHFLTGTDEHGQKVEKAAALAGLSPQAFTDKVSQSFRDLVKKMNYSPDNFIRTTEKRHYASTQAVWEKLVAAGDIYLGKYAGWYSVRDETYFVESETEVGPDSKRRAISTGAEVEWVEEPSYFFKLSTWAERLLAFYERNPRFIAPESRRNEVISFVKGGLQDLSVSRTSFSWGVPVPGDPKHVMYVWLDALTNYITECGYPDTTNPLWKYWPADLHMVGKDIIRFHCVFWPAFLMSAGIEPPQRVFAHGWWTNEGQKISKSLGNVIDPAELVDAYGLDPVRYFLLREVPFGNDGDLQKRALVGRLNGDLANAYGNLCQRVLSIVAKNCGEKVPAKGDISEADTALLDRAKALLGVVRAELDDQAFHRALILIWEVIADANRYVDAQAPWALAKTDPARRDTVLWVLAETIRRVTLLVQPFMPDSASRILDQLAVSAGERAFAAFDRALVPGTVLPKPQGVFPRFVEPRESRVLMLIDSHCHLDFPELAGDEAGVLARARSAGVAGMLTIGTRLDQFDKVRAIAERHENIWCSVGVHPHEAKEEGQRTPDRLVEATRHPKVVGIGETGLDFYYEHSPREEQAGSFRAHIAAARQTGLPLIVHTRDADRETGDILEEEYAKGGFTGLIHCFSSGSEVARRALALGMYISISGIVTFKAAEGLRAIVRDIPLERLLVETDAPYLAPVPKRGKTNEPAFVAHTAAKVAELKGVGVAELEAATTDNFFRLFAKAERIRCG